MKLVSDHKAALLGFAVSVAYWPGLLLAPFVPRWAVIAVGMPLIGTLDPRNVPEYLRWTLVFLIGVGAISLLVSPSPMSGVQDLLFIVFLCGVFLLGAELESFDGIMKGTTAGLALSLLLLVLQTFGTIKIPHLSPIPGALFDNSEILGEFAGLLLAWAVVKRHWVAAIIGALVVAWTQSRVGVLAAGAAMFFAYRPRSWVWTLLLALLVVAAALVLLPLKADSAMHRVTLWGAALMSFKLLGNGLGWGSAAFPFEEFVHSDALQAVIELGIGALALLAIPFAALKRNRGHHAERALFVGVCVEVLVSFPLHFPASGFLAAGVAGFLARARPVVRLGGGHRAIDDGRRANWSGAAGGAGVAASRSGVGALSVRSVPAALAALRSRPVGACAVGA